MDSGSAKRRGRPETWAPRPMTQPKVAYWLKQPTPYFVERCNAIADRGRVDLEAWFNTRLESDRSWEVDESAWRFKARYVGDRRTLGVRNRLPIDELRETPPDLLVQEYDRAYLAAGFIVARGVGVRSTFRVLPNFDAVSDRTWWRETAKHFLFRAVDGAKVSGPDGRALSAKYGLAADRTWTVTQVIDPHRWSKPRHVNPKDREAGRRALGLKGCVFIYVGRLLDVKGVSVLLDAFRRLNAEIGEEASLLVVGDGADEARYRAETADLPNVVFRGFVQAQELPEMYALADALVFPTLGDAFGLVVEEALAAGLPVISTTSAGDIKERLLHDGPGRVVEAGNPGALASEMKELATDADLRNQLASRSWERVEDLSPQRYAEEFEAHVEAVLAKPPRRGPAPVLAKTIGRAILASDRRRPLAIPVGQSSSKRS
jgi:glycosyltransferase involved in cell wall biosynthesis